MPAPVTSWWDRPSVAIANLIQKRPMAAARAIFAPSTLSPDQSKTLGEYLAEMSKTDPLIAGLIDTVVDPWLILGVGLSMRYPIAKLKDMFNVGKRYGVYTKRIGMLSGKLLRLDALYAGSDIPKIFAEHMHTKRAVEKDILTKLVVNVEKVTKALGRQPTGKELRMVGVKLEDIDNMTPPFVSNFIERWGKKAVVRGFRTQTQVFTEPIKLSGPLNEFYKDMHKFREYVHKQYMSPFFAVKEGGMNPEAVREWKLAMGLTPADAIIPGFYDPKIVRQIEDIGLRHHLKNYLPHFPIRSPAGQVTWLDDLAKTISEDVSTFYTKQLRGVKQTMARPLYKRMGVMVPEIDQLRDLPGFNPAFADSLKAAMQNYSQSVSKAFVGVEKEMRSWNMVAEAQGPIAEKLRSAMRSVGILPTRYQTELKQFTAAMQQGQTDRAADVMHSIMRSSLDVASYGIEPVAAFTSYGLSISRPYAWVVGPAGQGLLPGPGGTADRLRTAAEALGGEGRAILADYIPILQGRTNYAQTINTLRWTATRTNALDNLQRLDETQIGDFLPKKTVAWLKKNLADERGPFSYVNAMNKTASWFYHSTLGLNPASAFQNLLQPAVTTIPWIGTKAWAAGSERAMAKISKYFDFRGQGFAKDVAWEKAFPDFASTIAGQTSVSHQLLAGTLEQAWTQGVTAVPETLRRLGHEGNKTALDKIKKASMFLFSKSETWNRVQAFEGAMWKGYNDGSFAHFAAEAQKAGVGGAAAANAAAHQKIVDLAEQTVYMTQFAVGPGQMPHILLNLGAPWKQFMYFPLRFAGFLAESTRLPWGAGSMAKLYDPLTAGRNWGTIGRTMAASSVVYHGAKHLPKMVGLQGLDLSQGLMFGALPIPQIEGSPFYPFPVVPPVASLVGAGVMAAVGQTTEPLKRVAPLLIPGGIAGARAYKIIKYADYKNPDADGKIPMYNAQGSRIASYTASQLAMRAIGFQPDDMRKEQEMTGYLLKHRDQIRDVRRRYVNALLDNDTEEADRIQGEFHSLYPELGEITVKPSDLEAARRRREMTRLQRLLQTFPAAYRPQFESVMNVLNAQNTAAMLPTQDTPFAGIPLYQGSQMFDGYQQGLQGAGLSGAGWGGSPGVSNAFPAFGQ